MEDNMHSRCDYCSFLKAQTCESGTLSETAQIGTHTIYTCDSGGLSFCVGPANQNASNDDEMDYAEEIACMELNW